MKHDDERKQLDMFEEKIIFISKDGWPVQED